MANTLVGKIAIVTGASRGIGRQIAIEFAKRGAKGITITYASNEAAAEKTLAEIRSLGSQAQALKMPDADVASAEAIVQKTLEAFKEPGIDILVNNAGNMSLHQMGSMTADGIQSTFAVNVVAPLLLFQAVLPVIRRKGRVVNIGSRASRIAAGNPMTVYCASKAALDHVTRNLAVSYAAEKGITVNTVMPGGTNTDVLASAPKELIDRVVNDATAEKRLGTVEEVAGVVCFLCEGQGSGWINGDTINVTGGAAMW